MGIDATIQTVERRVRAKGDALGRVIGILTFLGGIALLVVTFKLALDMFQVPPDQALHLEKGKVLDVAVAGQSFGVLLLRVLLLIVMGLVGSLIANRGIKLYTESLLTVLEQEEPTNSASP